MIGGQEKVGGGISKVTGHDFQSEPSLLQVFLRMPLDSNSSSSRASGIKHLSVGEKAQVILDEMFVGLGEIELAKFFNLRKYDKDKASSISR